MTKKKPTAEDIERETQLFQDYMVKIWEWEIVEGQVIIKNKWYVDRDKLKAWFTEFKWKSTNIKSRRGW